MAQTTNGTTLPTPTKQLNEIQTSYITASITVTSVDAASAQNSLLLYRRTLNWSMIRSIITNSQATVIVFQPQVRINWGYAVSSMRFANANNSLLTAAICTCKCHLRYVAMLKKICVFWAYVMWIWNVNGFVRSCIFRWGGFSVRFDLTRFVSEISTPFLEILKLSHVRFGNCRMEKPQKYTFAWLRA